MNKLLENQSVSHPISPLSPAEQTHIKGGMATMDEDKKKKVLYKL